MASTGLSANFEGVTLQGYANLQKRLAAISGTEFGAGFMRDLGNLAAREQRQLMYARGITRRTGLSASQSPTSPAGILVGGVTDTSVATVARGYTVYLDQGTRPHVIMPRNKPFLAWPLESGGTRLTGRARKGYKGAWGISWHGVHHPGTKAYNFMLPGAQLAVERSGLRDRVIAAWNLQSEPAA